MRLANAPFPQIAATLNVKQNPARKIYYRWLETGDCSSASRSGALKKLTERDITHIGRHTRHDSEQRRQPLGEIIFDLNLAVFKSTLKRTLIYDLGMRHRIERKTSWLLRHRRSQGWHLRKSIYHGEKMNADV